MGSPTAQFIDEVFPHGEPPFPSREWGLALMRHKRRAGGWVYFATAGIADAPIKIGWTTYDPARRIKDLQCGSPVELTLLGAGRGDQRYETLLHRRFAQFRTHGEWFRRDPELLDFIARFTGARKRTDGTS